MPPASPRRRLALWCVWCGVRPCRCTPMHSGGRAPGAASPDLSIATPIWGVVFGSLVVASGSPGWSGPKVRSEPQVQGPDPVGRGRVLTSALAIGPRGTHRPNPRKNPRTRHTHSVQYATRPMGMIAHRFSMKIKNVPTQVWDRFAKANGANGLVCP